ncbi:uncharacterized protein EKO05_0009159 [Ascochyta rabiei]|uniref:Uncharacterized protein n=1 Tax=Didymella rabiei TaxID=5454 RepID=A0A163IQ23_DIDRA|nr:uncharacterized protein EKO05_0009159 [Ascochyta rabiei]KZM25876.1 hypothetical protein ST47_g2948 [Ascochyta rabiei]UPX18876.1 hypothetical protein EKO05_0009159 [Ascochyta rabiei]
MAPCTKTEYDTFKDRFLRLPRELRDLVYANVYADSAPVDMGTIDADPTSMALVTSQGHQLDPEHAAEVLEAFYTHNTFNVTFPDGDVITRTWPIPLSPHPQYHKYIRTLNVYAREADISPTASLRAIENRYKDVTFLRRVHWESFLGLPRLERLNIYLQKRHSQYFSWADFSPVLIELRQRLPRLQLTFSISFDTLLERYWSDPIWENYTEPGNVVETPYDPMGFVDISELIKAPTEEDVQYVQEHCSEQKGSPGRDILTGLLDETAPQRRALAVHYVVREPSLLRVRMMEHYETYKRTMRTVADKNPV